MSPVGVWVRRWTPGPERLGMTSISTPSCPHMNGASVGESAEVRSGCSQVQLSDRGSSGMTWGVSAASGKLGALAAAYLFPSLGSELNMLMTCGYASFAAATLTSYLIPECNHLSLEETDQRWHYIRAGRKRDYHGPASDPHFLSYYERHRRILRNKDDNVTALDFGDGGG